MVKINKKTPIDLSWLLSFITKKQSMSLQPEFKVNVTEGKMQERRYILLSNDKTQVLLRLGGGKQTFPQLIAPGQQDSCD